MGYRAWYSWGGIHDVIGSVPLENVLSIDLETTGIHSDSDEILQLSVCDGLGRTVINKLYRPVRVSSWPEAERVNGISPKDVRSANPFNAAEARKVSSLLNSADLIVGYNWYGFDRKFLKSVGVEVNRPCFDVMLEYPIVPGVWDDYRNHLKWWKLSQCAEHYSHEWSGRAHDALSDAIATAWCFRKMVEEGSDFCRASDAFHDGQWNCVLRCYDGTLRSEFVEYPPADELDDSVVRCLIYGLPEGLLAQRAEREIDQAISERGGRRYKSDAKGSAWTVIADPTWDASRCTNVFTSRHEKGKKVCYLPDLVEYLGIEAKSLGTKWSAGRKRAEKDLNSWFPIPAKLKKTSCGSEEDRPRVTVSSKIADLPLKWEELNANSGGMLRTIGKMIFGR